MGPEIEAAKQERIVMFSSAIVNFEMYDKDMFDLDEISKICTLIIDMT